VLLGQPQGHGFLVGVGAVEVDQRHACGIGLFLGLAAEGLGQVLGVVGVVLEPDTPLVQVALGAQGVVEQPRLAAEPQAVEAGQDKADQRPKPD
jgi:hypothetical protein